MGAKTFIILFNVDPEKSKFIVDGRNTFLRNSSSLRTALALMNPHMRFGILRSVSRPNKLSALVIEPDWTAVKKGDLHMDILQCCWLTGRQIVEFRYGQISLFLDSCLRFLTVSGRIVSNSLEIHAF